MPELPEAETIVRQVREQLRGVVLERVRHLRAGIMRAGSARGLRRLLPGQAVLAVGRRGKRVVLELEGGRRVVFGLGMTGHLTVAPAGVPVSRHTHLRVTLRDGRGELRFRDPRRFGGVWLLEAADDSGGFARLGADALEVDLRTFRRLLDRRRQIKALLLDQAVIAGLGNIYCDEALFRAGVHPQARAAGLTGDQVRRLHRSIRRVLRESIAAEGTTIDSYRTAWDRRGSFQRRLRVYGRDGEDCPRCGARILRIQAAGRSSHLCPVCQPCPSA